MPFLEKSQENFEKSQENFSKNSGEISQLDLWQSCYENIKRYVNQFYHTFT